MWHTREELRRRRGTDERATVSVGEQHRGLSEPATERDAVWRSEHADARTREKRPPEAHLKSAHPARVALGAHAGRYAGDPQWRIR